MREPTLLGIIFAYFCESFLVRKSQSKLGSAGRFLALLMHGKIGGDTLDSQGKRLNVLLLLVEGTGRPLDGNTHSVCISGIVSTSL